MLADQPPAMSARSQLRQTAITVESKDNLGRIKNSLETLDAKGDLKKNFKICNYRDEGIIHVNQRAATTNFTGETRGERSYFCGERTVVENNYHVGEF